MTHGFGRFGIVAITLLAAPALLHPASARGRGLAPTTAGEFVVCKQDEFYSYYIIPANADDGRRRFPLLTRSGACLFFGLVGLTDSQIEQVNLDSIREGHFPYYDHITYASIAGFSEYYEIIKDTDRYGLPGMKAEIVKRLKAARNTYKQEYKQRYLQTVFHVDVNHPGTESQESDYDVNTQKISLNVSIGDRYVSDGLLNLFRKQGLSHTGGGGYARSLVASIPLKIAGGFFSKPNKTYRFIYDVQPRDRYVSHIFMVKCGVSDLRLISWEVAFASGGSDVFYWKPRGVRMARPAEQQPQGAPTSQAGPTTVPTDAVSAPVVPAELSQRTIKALLATLQPVVSKGLIRVELRKRKCRLVLRFDRAGTVIAEDTKPAVAILAKALLKDYVGPLEVAGHTDGRSTATESARIAISIARAKGIAQLLSQNGILMTRLSIGGYGDTDPVGDNTTDSGERMNNRVEVVLWPRQLLPAP